MKKIIVYCEENLVDKQLLDVSYELISKAYELTLKAKELSNEDYIVEAVTISHEIKEESIKKAFMAGASRFVHIKDATFCNFSQTVFAQCFVEYYNNAEGDIIIFPATQKGRILAPRITTILDTGLVADCTGLDFIVRENKLKFAPTRPTFGSELMATIISKKNPQCATVRPKIFTAKFDKNIDGELNEFIPNYYQEPRMKLLRSILDKTSNDGDFSNAKIVFVAGYGLVDKKDRKYFTRLDNLAKIFGAKVGATRKVVDMGLMPISSQVGQTGSTIAPDVCVTFGVSGAIQHIMGMKNSKTIIAINTDENAEIFKYADCKMVTDAKAIIDEMLENLG